MVDTSNVDVRAFYERYSSIYGRKPSRNWRSGEMEYHGSCPWCGGTNRFMFLDPSGRYSCAIRSSGCGRHGKDVIDFLREYEGLNFFEACDTLDIDPGSEYIRSVAAPKEDTLDNPPPAKWLERAVALMRRAEPLLWSPRGRIALDYLYKRGFTDETIHAAHLGYIPMTNEGRWYRDSCDVWGLSPDADGSTDLWLPEGILIPWYVNGVLWKLTVRRVTGWKEGSAKYLPIAGSSEALYRADDIKPGMPVVLCESEFDALAGKQGYAGEDVSFVATGSTTRARRARWVTCMNEASHVLVAFDDDELDKNGKRAGDVGAKHWTTALERGTRWLPWCHDVNDMLLQGVDIPQWVRLGVAVAMASCPPVVCNEEQETEEGSELSLPVESALCSVCLDAGMEREALPDDYKGEMYCAEHHPAHQQAQPDQVQPSETPALSEDERRQQFMQSAQHIADELPDGCTVRLNPLDYTIQDAARELQEHHAEEPDYWRMIHSNVERPPVDDKNKPFYSRQAWRAKFADLQNWHPEARLYAHFPGGYEGYAAMHRRRLDDDIQNERRLAS